MSRLRSRVREQAGVLSTGLSISQLALLGRVIGERPTTAAALAAVEHVSQQAIAQNLATLKAAGLVRAKPDPEDRRKSLISATPAAGRLRQSLLQSKEAWLTRAIQASVPAHEWATLEAAIALLERLAGADPAPPRIRPQ
ncbi:MAG: MarR family winged helix-turn-helix transcriptional regulator [Solirubrobacteraceae bacterium]